MKPLKLALTLVLTIVVISACKKSINQVSIDELGFTMQLPNGWQVDNKNPNVFYDINNPDDNLGQVVDYDLKADESLSEFVDSLIADEQMIFEQEKNAALAAGINPDSLMLKETQIARRENISVDGLEAIEMVSTATYTVYDVFILKDETIINVSFRTLPDNFSNYEPLFKTAIKTIKIKRD